MSIVNIQIIDSESAMFVFRQKDLCRVKKPFLYQQ